MSKRPSRNPTGTNGHTAAVACLREATRTFSEEALHKIVEIMRTADDQELQLRAAETLLDRAWGKPSQQIDLIRHDMQIVATLSREDLLRLAPAAMDVLQGSVTNG
jgi:hypothetical protein